MDITVLEDTSGSILSEGRIPGSAGAAGESRVVSGGESAALAVGMVVVFALLVWSSLITLGFGRGCMKLGALPWKVRRFRLILGFTPWRLQTSLVPVSFLPAFDRVLGFFGISNCVKSPEPSFDVGHALATASSAECDNICSCAVPPSPSRSDNPTLHESDLKELISLVNETDGGPSWRLMMERSNVALSYQAWYRDPPVGPMQCRTRTVFENVSPELLRDFFWDDEFRIKWDKMLVHFETLHVCPQTGTMVVHWIRKLPIICSEKEYVIVRRIWESNSNYYCITKGNSHPSLPKSTARRRIELYYSSWCIRSVKSRNNEQATASEVVFFHWEDLGIPRELVKMGARAGMWGLVKRMHSGVQAYKDLHRSPISLPSTYSLLARITTKFEMQLNMDTVRQSEANSTTSERDARRRKTEKGSATVKWLVVGGLLIASGLTLKANGTGILCEVAKCLQMFCRRRKQLKGRKGSEETIGS